MSRDRKKNRTKVWIEKALEWKNVYDVKDPVPRLAVEDIITEQKQIISQAGYWPASEPWGGA